MANTARTQMALASSLHFQSRVTEALSTVAWQILAESNATPNHTERVAYARQVIDGPANYAARLSSQLATRPNLFAFATSYDFEVGAVVTASADADIESQLSTDWDILAGVQS